MDVHIDFSIFASPTQAYGNVTGKLDLPALPRVGSRLSLMPLPGATPPMPSFPGVRTELRVEAVIPMDSPDMGVVVSLETLVLENRMQAREAARYFERAFGFFAWAYWGE